MSAWLISIICTGLLFVVAFVICLFKNKKQTDDIADQDFAEYVKNKNNNGKQ